MHSMCCASCSSDASVCCHWHGYRHQSAPANGACAVEFGIAGARAWALPAIALALRCAGPPPTHWCPAAPTPRRPLNFPPRPGPWRQRRCPHGPCSEQGARHAGGRPGRPRFSNPGPLKCEPAPFPATRPGGGAEIHGPWPPAEVQTDLRPLRCASGYA